MKMSTKDNVLNLLTLHSILLCTMKMSLICENCGYSSLISVIIIQLVLNFWPLHLIQFVVLKECNVNIKMFNTKLYTVPEAIIIFP